MLVGRCPCSSYSPWYLALEEWCCPISWLSKETSAMAQLPEKARYEADIYANEPTRWTRYLPSLMDAFTRTKRASPRQRGRRTKHIFDWMAHATNLAKGSTLHIRHDRSLCPFCREPETHQHHINVSCTHPPIVEMRQALKRQIMNFFQSYRHLTINVGSSPLLITLKTLYGRTPLQG